MDSWFNNQLKGKTFKNVNSFNRNGSREGMMELLLYVGPESQPSAAKAR